MLYNYLSNCQVLNNIRLETQRIKGFTRTTSHRLDPPPRCRRPAYHDAVDRTTYPPTLPQQQQQQPPRTDPQVKCLINIYYYVLTRTLSLENNVFAAMYGGGRG